MADLFAISFGALCAFKQRRITHRVCPVCRSGVRETRRAQPAHCNGGHREGSQWCLDSAKRARELGIPIVSGCRYPLFKDEPHFKAYPYMLTNTWTIADYKSFAAHGGKRHDKMITVDGGEAKKHKEAKGGVVIVDFECMEVNYPEDHKDAFTWEPAQGLDNGQIKKVKDTVQALSTYPTAQYNSLYQVQAFWQQELTMLESEYAIYVASDMPMGPNSLIAWSRTSLLNDWLKMSLEGNPQGGCLSLKDTRFNIVSINDICYWGPELAKALGTEVRDDDRDQCMKACAESAKYLKIVPYMYHALPAQMQVCDRFKHGWYDSGGLGKSTSCKYGDEVNKADA